MKAKEKPIEIGIVPPVEGRKILSDLAIVIGAVSLLILLTLPMGLFQEFYRGISIAVGSQLTAGVVIGFYLFIICLAWMVARHGSRATSKAVELESILSGISLDVLMVVAPDRTIRRCNRSIKHVFGYEIEEVLHQKTSLLYGDRRNDPGRLGEIYSVLEKQGFHVGQATGKKKNGEPIHLEIVTGTLKNSSGAVLLLRDITHRRALEAIWKKYEFIANSSTDFMVLIGPGHIYEAVNDSYCHAQGKKREEIIGASVSDIWGEEIYHHKIQQKLDRCFSGEEMHDQAWFEFASLGKRCFDVTYNPYAAFGGRITHVVVVSRDITGTKQAEEELKELNVTLEQRVVERTKEMKSQQETAVKIAEELARSNEDLRREIAERKNLQEQLLQSQKMESIGRLAGGIAHDFNNQLTVIDGYSEFLLEGIEEGDPKRAEVEEIVKATEHASKLTQQLLAFSRRQVTKPLVFDLNDRVMKLDQMFRRLLSAEIELVTLPQADSKMIKVDPGQLEQVLVNLVVNARDAMAGGGKLTLETENVSLGENYVEEHRGVPSGDYVMLSVKDTGCGMTEEVRSRIFEPFYTTKERGKGSGLGLSTSYGIVKQNGGHIWVYSKPQKGTTFKIYFPVVEEPADVLPKRVVSKNIPRGTETILLVEDEASLQAMAIRSLRKQGYQVIEASNGEEALRCVEQRGGEKIDLLVTDVVMPQMGGRELEKKMKELFPELKVLFISGYTDRAVASDSVLGTDAAFLQKPFTPAALAIKIREVLDKQRKDVLGKS